MTVCCNARQTLREPIKPELHCPVVTALGDHPALSQRRKPSSYIFVPSLSSLPFFPFPPLSSSRPWPTIESQTASYKIPWKPDHALTVNNLGAFYIQICALKAESW